VIASPIRGKRPLADRYRVERELITNRLDLCRVSLVLLCVTACAPQRPPAPTPTSFTAVDQVSGTTQLLIGISPVNENIVWASGTGGTWVRTIDGGTTWQAGRVPGADTLQFRDVHAVDAIPPGSFQ